MNFTKVCLALSCAAAFSLMACGDDDSNPAGGKLGGGSTNGSKVGSCDFSVDDDVWEYSYGVTGEKTTVTFTFGSGTSYTQKIKVSVNGAVTTQTIDGDYEDEYGATREEFFESTMITCKNLNKATITSSSSKGGKSSSSKGLVDDEPLDEENYTCKTEGAKRTIDGIPAVCYQGYWIPEEYADFFDDDDDYGSDDDDYDDWDTDMTADMLEFLDILESGYYDCDTDGEETVFNGVPSVCEEGTWTPKDMIAKYVDTTCTDGATDTYKFKLPDGTFANMLIECDDGDWTLQNIVMP